MGANPVREANPGQCGVNPGHEEPRAWGQTPAVGRMQALGPSALRASHHPAMVSPMGPSPGAVGDPAAGLVRGFLGRRGPHRIHSSPVWGKVAGTSPAVRAGLAAPAVMLANKIMHLNS